MKPITLFFAAALAVILTGCNVTGRKGNGTVTTQNHPVKPFTELIVKGIFPVQLSQDGTGEWVKVETDENLQKFVTVIQEGNRLKIDLHDDARIQKSTKMKVYVNVKGLTQIKMDGIGSLNTQGYLKLDSLNFISEAVGSTQLNLEAKYLHADIKSVGNTRFRGSVKEARINNKGIGNLNAFDLKAETCMIHNTAIGVTEIYADSFFYIRSSAVGKLTYKGPATVKELNAEGIGKVNHIE